MVGTFSSAHPGRSLSIGFLDGCSSPAGPVVLCGQISLADESDFQLSAVDDFGVGSGGLCLVVGDGGSGVVIWRGRRMAWGGVVEVAVVFFAATLSPGLGIHHAVYFSIPLWRIIINIWRAWGRWRWRRRE